MAPEKLRRAIFLSLILVLSFRFTVSDQPQDKNEEKPTDPADEDELTEIKTFLRQPAYIILIVIFILIFIAMWFVPDLPPHGTKKTKK